MQNHEINAEILWLAGKAHTIGYPSIWNIAGSHHRLP
jgi:hypothetical protein